MHTSARLGGQVLLIVITLAILCSYFPFSLDEEGQKQNDQPGMAQLKYSVSEENNVQFSADIGIHVAV